MLQSLTTDMSIDGKGEETTINVTSAGELLVSESDLNKMKVRLSYFRGSQFRNSARFTLKFNGIVEPTSILNGNIRFSDREGRLDKREPDMTEEYHIGQQSYCSGKTVDIPLISKTGLSILNRMRFAMDVTSDVKGRIESGSDLMSLANPALGLTGFRTEYPHIQISLSQLTLTSNMDGIFSPGADVHFLATVAVANRTVPYIKTTNHSEYELSVGESHDIIGDIGDFTPQTDGDQLIIGFRAVDKDRHVDLQKFIPAISESVLALLASDSTANYYVLAAKIAFAVAQNFKTEEYEDIMGDTEYRTHAFNFNDKFWRGINLLGDAGPWYASYNELRAGTYTIKYSVILNTQ
jgi:hypothetical protein